MKGPGKWTTFLTFLYYSIGTVYYVYKWLLILGFSGLIAGAIYVSKRPSYVGGILTTASVLISGAGVAFWRRVAKLQLLSQNPCLRFSDMAVDYEILNNQTCHYTKTIQGWAIFPVDHYIAKYLWSGSGIVVPATASPGYSVTLNELPASHHDMCRVTFARLLNKGERFSFSYKLELKDATKPLRPFLGHTVDSPIKNLSLRVKFPPDNSVRSFRKQLFVSNRAELPLWEEIVSLDHVINEAVWEISHAKPSYFYRISW